MACMLLFSRTHWMYSSGHQFAQIIVFIMRLAYEIDR